MTIVKYVAVVEPCSIPDAQPVAVSSSLPAVAVKQQQPAEYKFLPSVCANIVSYQPIGFPFRVDRTTLHRGPFHAHVAFNTAPYKVSIGRLQYAARWIERNYQWPSGSVDYRLHEDFGTASQYVTTVSGKKDPDDLDPFPVISTTIDEDRDLSRPFNPARALSEKLRQIRRGDRGTIGAGVGDGGCSQDLVRIFTGFNPDLHMISTRINICSLLCQCR